ncbi:MAG: hypothetical protein IBJ00_07135 [Alphaproteobacteria bacterium]|nr:hypothetical protein [Alphaproteobacteria bacterium]
MKTLTHVLSTALIGTFFALPLTAGELRVVNENKKQLHIKLIPEGAATESVHKSTYKIRPESYIVLKIQPKHIDNKGYFSIKGDTNWAGVGNDTCEHISVHKNYRVTFQNNTIGTTCVAEEIQDQEK